MIDTSEIKVFPNKSLSDLLEDVYQSSSERRDTIQKLIDQLADLIEKPEHANIIVPLIKEYLEVDVSNEKQKIEIAKIVQRLESAYIRADDSKSSTGAVITDAEKDEIRKMVGSYGDERKKELKELDKKKEEVLDNVKD